MPTPTAQIMQAHTAHTPPFPALYLYPLNDSFIPKHISLLNNQRVKIGRQTNAKTVPGERNGYFDSKVLSRQHAEVWEETSKIFIKDVKSSNGTFINGDRLSAEGVESDPYELKTDDIVEFGIDIVGEDNKTIIHHKVAARVTCIFNVEDALAAQREAYNFTQQQNQQPTSAPAGTLGTAAHKRPMLQPQSNGVGIMGGMGGGARQPGRNGLTFDHILSRLAGELRKSRETGAELGAVAGAMGEIENVMGGGQPPNLPPYPHVLPPVRPSSQQPQSQQQQPQQHQGDSESSSVALQALQNQLAETQASLSSHVDKVHTLESLLSDHENIKRDVNALRELIEEQRDRQRMTSQRMHAHEEDDDDDDDDDRRSVHTIVPHELESVPEEDESEMEETEEERSARREELGRPRTPEPSSLGMHDDDYEREHRRTGPSQPPGIPDEMTRRLTFLSDQLESALELSRRLQEQHSAAQQTIGSLESKVNALEELVRATQATQTALGAQHAEEAATREQAQQANMVSMFAEFRKTIEDRWDSVKSDWEAERERMETARGEWEGRVRCMEEGVAGVTNKFESGISGLANQLAGIKQNGYIPVSSKHTGGLVTPPSPRSLSDADSDSDRPLQEKGGVNGVKGRKRSRSRRGRTTKAASRSRSPATSTSATLVDGMSAPGTESSVASLQSRRSSTDSPSAARGTGTEAFGDPGTTPLALDMAKFTIGGRQFPPTPESCVHLDEAAQSMRKGSLQHPGNNLQVALGVFVLGFATAAVLWRVKE